MWVWKPEGNLKAGQAHTAKETNTMVKEEWTEKGYIDEPADNGTDLAAEIRRMCKEKDAIILAHYYTDGSVQKVADFIGDSLALARKAAKTDAKIIVMCGVHFMAETCKILCPEKLVICPDLNAGCSLADSCRAEDLKKFKQEHPGYTVVSYVNTTAAVKALTDVVVTSGNAKKIVDQLPKDEKIIFGPDHNLGSYINAVTGREMLLWNGGCHVHERFSPQAIVEMKKEHPDAHRAGSPRVQGSRSEACRRGRLNGSAARLCRGTSRQEVYRGNRAGHTVRDAAPVPRHGVPARASRSERRLRRLLLQRV